MQFLVLPNHAMVNDFRFHDFGPYSINKGNLIDVVRQLNSKVVSLVEKEEKLEVRIHRNLAFPDHEFR